MTEVELDLYTKLQPFFIDKLGAKGEGKLRFPLPIDPENMKRGLLGMVRNIKQIDKDVFDNWWCHIVPNPGFSDGYRRFQGATPSEAILKALCAQEGV